MSNVQRSTIGRIIRLGMCVPFLVLAGCETTPSKGGPGGGSIASAPADDTLHVQRSTAQKFMELDRLCWSMTLEWQRPKDTIAVTLSANYDTGETSGKGVYVTGGSAREVIDKALAEIEGRGKKTSGVISSEDEVLQLADGLTVFNRHCWYLSMVKSGDWTVTAKVLKQGDLRGKTHRAVNESLLAAVNEAKAMVEAASR